MKYTKTKTKQKISEKDLQSNNHALQPCLAEKHIRLDNMPHLLKYFLKKHIGFNSCPPSKGTLGTGTQVGITHVKCSVLQLHFIHQKHNSTVAGLASR